MPLSGEIVAGVAAAADEHAPAAERRRQLVPRRVHEAHRRHAGQQRGQRRAGLRPLQREQRLLRQLLDRAARADALAHPRQVLHLARGVDDQEVFVAVAARTRPVRQHQVVEQSAGLVGEVAVALAAQRQADDVDRDQALERGGRVGAADAHLAHVRDVEQAGAGASRAVLGHHAAGVLDRHFIAGERHHLGTQAQVQLIKRRAQQRFGHARLLVKATTRRNSGSGDHAPLSLVPERLTGARRQLAPSVGAQGGADARRSPVRLTLAGRLSPFA
ncbi:hypothetical protein GALL_405330 [mine drainage metagenome]|uniref:Uncharacterized protein n=1 Tax=mine drainage metagenome TaxID=410659 RepID=A0A1J5QCP9_9ZZZZ